MSPKPPRSVWCVFYSHGAPLVAEATRSRAECWGRRAIYRYDLHRPKVRRKGARRK